MVCGAIYIYIYKKIYMYICVYIRILGVCHIPVAAVWWNTDAWGQNVENSIFEKTPPAGLEPAIFGLEVRRLVH